jgi:hypothetical protein
MEVLVMELLTISNAMDEPLSFDLIGRHQD